MRFRRAELLEEVRFFFYETPENETRYAQTVIFRHLKKNTALLVVLTLLQMHSNLPLAMLAPEGTRIFASHTNGLKLQHFKSNKFVSQSPLKVKNRWCTPEIGFTSQLRSSQRLKVPVVPTATDPRYSP